VNKLTLWKAGYDKGVLSEQDAETNETLSWGEF
jgi:hypothetical protein